MFRTIMQSIDAELLITLIRNRPVIWDKFLASYRDKTLRTAAWHEVCNILNENFEDMDELQRQEYAKIVVKKWNHLRDSWVRTVAERKDNKKSGCADGYIRKYTYHKHMLFLKKVVQPTAIDNSTNEETYSELDQVAAIIQEREQKTNQIEQVKPETFVNDSPRQDNSDHSVKRNKRRYAPKQKLNATDQKVFTFIDHQMKSQHNLQKEDRNLSFFKSLLPSLAFLDDDQVLEFQAGVIGLIQRIKSHNYEGSSRQPSTSNCLNPSPQCCTPQYPVQLSSRMLIQSSEKNSSQPSPAPKKRSRGKSSKELDDVEIDNEITPAEVDPLTGAEIKIEFDGNISDDEVSIKSEQGEADNSANEERSDDPTHSDTDGNEIKPTVSTKNETSSTASASGKKTKLT